MTGTFPLNRDIFPDHEYAPFSVTDRPRESDAETALAKIGGHRKKKAAILTDIPEKERIEAEESSRVRKHPPPLACFLGLPNIGLGENK